MYVHPKGGREACIVTSINHLTTVRLNGSLRGRRAGKKELMCVNMIIYAEKVLLLNVVFSNITVIQSLSPFLTIKTSVL